MLDLVVELFVVTEEGVHRGLDLVVLLFERGVLLENDFDLF